MKKLLLIIPLLFLIGAGCVETQKTPNSEVQGVQEVQKPEYCWKDDCIDISSIDLTQLSDEEIKILDNNVDFFSEFGRAVWEERKTRDNVEEEKRIEEFKTEKYKKVKEILNK